MSNVVRVGKAATFTAEDDPVDPALSSCESAAMRSVVLRPVIEKRSLTSPRRKRSPRSLLLNRCSNKLSCLWTF